MYDIEITGSPPDLLQRYETIFTNDALEFMAELAAVFEVEINELYCNRALRKCNYKKYNLLPKFERTQSQQNKNWIVSPLPIRLLNRRIDLGDVSPSNTKHLRSALLANVQGIQIDFDDGHCPTWRNQIIGLHNVYEVVHGGDCFGNANIENLPILMLRPRAWNMTEHNIRVNGKELPGAIVDFAILMFHNAHALLKALSGPYFYLSKLESASEAGLWNKIFIYAQSRLLLPYGTIKACVLIENILAVFEMDDILFELKDHCMGLNCGIWDYAASIICKFGSRKQYVLPDRNKYVDVEKTFIKKYIEAVVQVCHARGTYATGGMAAALVPNEKPQATIDKVITAKNLELMVGVDGFIVYDIKLIPHMNKLWELGGVTKQIVGRIPTEIVTAHDLLLMPVGGVTMDGLKHNIAVTILFIYNWLNGIGHFVYRGHIEDSATAEISRSQIWQWIYHQCKIENTGELVSIALIHNLAGRFTKDVQHTSKYDDLTAAKTIFLHLVTGIDFPDFITTYLNDNYIFRDRHKHNELLVRIKHKL